MNPTETPPVYCLGPLLKEKLISEKILTSRQIAKAFGDATYYGTPCRHGHVGKRYVYNKSCVDCKNEKKKNRKTLFSSLFVGPPKRRGRRRGSLYHVRVVRQKSKNTKEKFVPVTEKEKWIVRNRNSKTSSAGGSRRRTALSVELYKELTVDFCPLLGVPLQYEKFEGNRCPDNYATLDRIDSSKGYEEGNVIVISFRANSLKNSATIEEMKTIVKNWESL